jgi:hypothetical protein
VDSGPALVADDQAAELPISGKRPLHDPAITSQLSTAFNPTPGNAGLGQDLLPNIRRHYQPCVDAPGGARRIFGLIQRVVRAAMCAASHAAHRPRARMEVRGSGPNQTHVLTALVDKLVVPIPSQ